MADSDPTVLVLRALHLGDLLVVVPALRALRRAFPDHRIVLATRAPLAPLVALLDAVDELLPTDEPADLRWDRPPPEVAVNLHGTGPQSHRALDALSPHRRIGFRAPAAHGPGRDGPGWDGPGWDGPEWGRVAGRFPHERDRWCALLRHHGIATDATDLALPAPAGPGVVAPGPGAPVLVHPGARFGAKRWPVERFAAVAATLTGAGRSVLVTGSADELRLADAVAGLAGLGEDRVLAGRTDLRQLAALVAGAGLVICGDTGIAHLASAFGTPSVVLFGPVDPARWGPPRDGPHRTLTDAAVRRGDPFADDPDPALLAVSVDDVLEAARASGRVL